jgi:hypothetical protein
MWFMDKKCDWFWYELMSTLGMLKKRFYWNFDRNVINLQGLYAILRLGVDKKKIWNSRKIYNNQVIVSNWK